MPNDPEFNNEAGYDNETESGQTTPPPLNKNQKIAVAVLAVFALFVFIMWGVQFKRNISAPFAYQGSENTTSTATGEQTDADLQAKDTDKDGLSDYDELYLYKTSPYLEDSDSDSYSDKTEVDSGKDPNCPTGKTCGSLGTDTTSLESDTSQSQDNSTLNNLLNQFNATGQTGQSATGTSSQSAASSESILSGSIDAATLRQMLLQSGMDKAVLDKISDQELMQSYQEMLKSQ